MEYTYSGRGTGQTKIFAGGEALQRWGLVARLNRQEKIIADLEKLVREQEQLMAEPVEMLEAETRQNLASESAISP